MKGLFYKHLISSGERTDFAGFGGMCLLAIVARILIEIGIFDGIGLITAASGETINLIEFILSSFPILCISFMMSSIAGFKKIMERDGKKSTVQMIKALPVSQDKYICSIYLYNFFAMIGFLILGYIACAIVLINGQDNMLYGVIRFACYGLITGFTFFIMIGGLDGIFCMRFGNSISNKVRLGILFMLLFGAMAFFLFADLSFLDRLDLYTFIKWCETNMNVIRLISCFTPVIFLAIYFASMFICCRVCRKRGMIFGE